MSVLIVGAGAVGQVFGLHLALGGAEVTLYVKPKYASQRAFTMYPLNTRRHPAVRFGGFGVLTTAAEVAAKAWDLVILTVSSTALREGTWLAELAVATGDATIVMLQPSLDDRAVVERAVDPARIVDGMIGFISYQAPLPGESGFDLPGMAYWFPPGSPSPFSGSDARVLPLLASLHAGKLPAVRKPDVRQTAVYPSAILFAFLAAVEANHWEFGKARGELGLASRAARAALAVAAAETAEPPGLLVRLAARPIALRAIMRFGPWVMPLPLEAYMKAHFTKVADQTRLALHTYIARGRAANVDVAPIEELLARLE